MGGALLSLSLLDTIYCHPQVSFGGSSGSKKSSGNNNVDIADISSRWQGGGAGQSQCCCIRQFESCLDQLTGSDDLVGEGLIDQRIVNRPGSGSGGSGGSGGSTCPSGQKLCCFSGTPPRSQRSQCQGSGFSSSLTSGGGSSGSFSSEGVWREILLQTCDRTGPRRVQPRRVPLDLPHSQLKQRLHRHMRHRPQELQQRQLPGDSQGPHRCPQPEERGERAGTEGESRGVRRQCLQEAGAVPARGVQRAELRHSPEVRS